ncbi:MAG TPA: 8-amino-7-oxononanoate synthase [Terriglobia bacterium]|nr:8-amino-7-oxononanoate synthase [Terriglobia bacterium]
MHDSANGATLARLASELGALEGRSQLRHLALSSGIDLMSNDYLGLSRSPCLREAVLRSIAEGESMASTGSRLLSGNARVWEELEEEFAAFAGMEAALFFSSGYAANLGLLGSLLRPEDVVFTDASNHASLIDGIRLSRTRKIIFPHLDLDFLEQSLRESPGGQGEKFIVVESIFSMEGDRAPLSNLAALAEQYGAALIVDEAHSVGVCGAEGRGLLAETGLTRFPLAAVFPCGKALASCGAFVACSISLKQFLVNRARTFIFSTALPPYMARQISAAVMLARGAEEERNRLRSISAALRARLQDAGLNTGSSDSQIVPVILGSNVDALAAAERLNRAGFAIRAIRPPSVPEGTARLRISMNADIPMEITGQIAEVLATTRATARGATGGFTS